MYSLQWKAIFVYYQPCGRSVHIDYVIIFILCMSYTSPHDLVCMYRKYKAGYLVKTILSLI